MPKEDLGQIFVGQLRTGELYALPASYYDFDLAVPESTGKVCAPGDPSCSSVIAPVSQPSGAACQCVLLQTCIHNRIV